MLIVLFTALGVGGATIAGSVLGFLFKGFAEKFSSVVLAFAGGVMLLASVNGLIMPSLETGGAFSAAVTVTGIFFGAALIFVLNKLTPQLSRLMAPRQEGSRGRTDKVLLFVLAIAIHNLPEGIATGVAFGGGDVADAITVAIGIALQNIPEGMVIISPMLSAGIGKWRTFFYAALTGVIEIIGTFIGYFAISVSSVLLPFALALAGGCMLWVISEEIIPEAHGDEGSRGAGFALLVGFCFMLLVSYYI